MSKHTRGPWTLNPSMEMPVVGVELKDGMPLLPIVETVSGRDETQARENARLIAAAPELLGACLLLIEYHLNANGTDMDGYFKAVNAAQQAIAKATGEES